MKNISCRLRQIIMLNEHYTRSVGFYNNEFNKKKQQHFIVYSLSYLVIISYHKSVYFWTDIFSDNNIDCWMALLVRYYVQK